MSADDRLDELSDPLYAGPPADFVARRDALAALAGADGDRGLAAALKGLRRPTVGAWYLNTAARAGLVSLRELLKLGQELRDAQAGGELARLRELAARRGPLVGRVLRDLTSHLAELGTTATPAGLDEVRRTLAAALADPEVAELTRRGRLDRVHDYSGFGPPVPPTDPAPATRATASQSGGKPSAPTPHDEAGAERSAERAEAEATLARAGQHLAEAAAEVGAAETTLAAARSTADGLAAALERARADVAAAEASLSEAAGREQLAAQALEQARQALRGLAD